MTMGRFRRICDPSAWWIWTYPSPPDAFGLRAFDNKKPLTRMLPGSTPCELRLMLPDSSLGTDGFHDVLIDLITCPRLLLCSRVTFRQQM